MIVCESTWNKFNEAKAMSEIAVTKADREALYALLNDLQRSSDRNYNSAQDANSKLSALTLLRTNEQMYAEKIVNIETSRREWRGWYIFCLVILNSVQFSYIFYLLLNFVYEARR